MTNIALILSGSIHHERSNYGHKRYDADQRNGYASLMFETDFDEHHNLSTGLSLNHDHMSHDSDTDETTPGVYAQYTYKIGELLTLMGGLRWDHSSLWGSFVTPRMHVKYSPTDWLTLRGSVGKGYRTPHILAENSYLLASNRTIVVDENIGQEKAWNYGFSAQLKIPVGGRTLDLNAEYYYTRFNQQAIIDYDVAERMIEVHGLNDHEKSYSHTIQVDATYEILPKLNVTAAWRCECSGYPFLPALEHLCRRREPDGLQAEECHHQRRQSMESRLRCHYDLWSCARSRILHRCTNQLEQDIK
jgi:outer membrane receptor protein involved in Fe transport